MTTFYVPLEKCFIGPRTGDHMTVQGYMPLEAASQDDARDKIDEMLNRLQDNTLQTCDPRIVWEDYELLDGWDYEDFSFGVPDDADDDWSERP